MRHPDPADHVAHDQLLVAAYAAGDAEGTDLQAATALVAACGDCASLHHDLRHIAAALPAMTAPVRPRDFRLTAEQAAAFRPAGWRGFLLPLAGPRFSFAAPLGSGLAALGIAGLLLTGGGSVLPTLRVEAPVTESQRVTANGVPEPAATAAPAGQVVPAGDPSAAPKASPVENFAVASADAGAVGPDGNTAGSADGTPSDPAFTATSTPAAPASDLAIVFVLSGLGLATGVLLVGARFVARSATRSY